MRCSPFALIFLVPVIGCDDAQKAPAGSASCALGTAAHCASCGDVCSQRPGVAGSACEPAGASHACVITSCTLGHRDLDGDATNGCEYACEPTNPSTETCDGADNDCDGVADNEDAAGCVTLARDDDGDGLGRADDSRCLCEATGSYTATSQGDCDDAPGLCGAACRLGAPEQCDGYDNDCDGTTDEEGATGCTVHYRDQDLDTFGDAASSRCLCGPSGTYTADVAGDCSDSPSACGADCHPGAPEECGTDDRDCDGSPTAEGAIGCLSFYRDDDGDGFGVDADTRCLCGAEAPYSATVGGDCDDSPWGCGERCSPGAPELCDLSDNDCSGSTDEGCELAVSTLTAGNSGLVNNSVRALALGSSGLWVGTAAPGGVSRMAPSASVFHTVAGLSALPISSVAVDGSGAAFIGYEEPNCDASSAPCECELTRWSNGSLTTLCTDTLAGASNDVTSFAVAGSNHVVIGTSENYGVYFASPGAVACDEAAAKPITAVVAFAGSVVVGTPVSLRWCTTAWTPAASCSDTCSTYTTSFAGNDEVSGLLHVPYTGVASQSFVSGGSALLVASLGNGLAVWDADAQTFARRYNTTLSGLPSMLLTSVVYHAASKRLFLGTQDQGLTRCTVDTASFALSCRSFRVADGLAGDSVRALALDEASSILWVGTSAGLSKVTLY